MLRRLETNPKKAVTVVPIDNGQSEWRTMWVGDTVEVDGEKWLRQNKGGEEDVLLLVYPVVGQDFTSKMLRAYGESRLPWGGAENLLTRDCSGYDDHCGGYAECEWFYGFCEGDNCGLDGEGDAHVGESVADSTAELCWQGRGVVHLREEGCSCMMRNRLGT